MGGDRVDPELDLLFFGTGNASTWYRALRGQGDSLYTASILAVKSSTGELAWHFQTTPGDSFDYDATQPLVQADLLLNGRPRKVILQANKNGFFYVLDRQTGEFLSAAPFVSGITWASGIDTRRPAGRSNSRAWRIEIRSCSHRTRVGRTTGTRWHSTQPPASCISPRASTHRWCMCRTADGNTTRIATTSVSTVTMKDRCSRKWSRCLRRRASSWHGTQSRRRLCGAPHPVLDGAGVLATGGNLIFQGRADGIFAAYRATDGEPLWRFDAATGIMAPPVTYTVDGVQYVTVLAGWGGAAGLMNTPAGGAAKPGFGRILTFALNGAATLAAPPFGHKDPPVPAITTTQDVPTVHKGLLLFNSHCFTCHGLNAVAGPLPDLRYSSKATLDALESIVLGGARESGGMPSFKKVLTAREVDAIRAYIVSRSQETATPASASQRR